MIYAGPHLARLDVYSHVGFALVGFVSLVLRFLIHFPHRGRSILNGSELLFREHESEWANGM